MSVKAQLADLARCHGSRPYLVDATTGVVTTFGEVQDVARDLDVALCAALPAGAPVGLAMAEPAAYAAAYVALLSLGRTVVPLAPTAPAAESARILAAVGASHWLGQPDTRPGARDTAFELYKTDAAEGGTDLDGGGVVMFTSGTTGRPKGVGLRTDQLWRNADAVVRAHDFEASDIGFCPLPLWHINAQVVGVLGALRAGSCLVVDAGFHRGRFWDIASRYDVTWLNIAPAIIHSLSVDEADIDSCSLPPRLRFARSASAPLPDADRERFEARFRVPIVESYGMTEAAGMITVNALNRPRKSGSAGRPADVRLRIVDEQARPVSPEKLGAVQISGESVITSYLDGAQADRFAPDGWLMTGDLGYLDTDGDLFLAGRSDDVINRGGEMVHPREVEDVVLGHPQVDAAAVVGLPDEMLGERVIALIVRNDKDSTRPDRDVADELAAIAAAQLSGFKRPGEYRFVAELPVGATGKIRHRAARAMVVAPNVVSA